MITYMNRKVTPNQFAKLLVLEYGQGAFYWQEKLYSADLEDMTERERKAVEDAVQKQYDRVEDFLGTIKILFPEDFK